MGSEHYCLRWNNHQSTLLGVFSQLLEAGSLVDVTLASSEGHSLRAHKVVLSACSSYFRSLFLDHPNRHPIVILKDVGFWELRTLIHFMYRGEVSVETCRLPALLKTAESLQVKGLAEMTALKSRSGGGGGGESGGGEDRPESSPPPPGSRLSPSPLPPPPPAPGGLLPPPPAAPAPAAGPPAPDLITTEEEDEGDDGTDSVQSGPSDMTVSQSRPHSPPAQQLPVRHQSPVESLPGPSSGLPPVQDAPLSLKKEVDWDRGEETKSTAEGSSDYRHPHDPESGEAMYSCLYCGAVLPSQSKLSRHLLSHSLDSLRYRSEILERTVSGLGGGGGGPQFLLPEPPPPSHSPGGGSGAGSGGGALCKFCGKTFPDVGSLIGHLPAHTGDRPFKCEFCGKAFKLRHHMKDHCRVHTGERPFRCSLCGKTFSRSTILKAHEKTHYPKYVRKFLSPSPPEDAERRGTSHHHMPCDLSVDSVCLPRYDLPTDAIYLPRTSPSP